MGSGRQPLERVAVVGEALIDLVPDASTGAYRVAVGGSPFNVAVALARLGRPVALRARFSTTGFGPHLRSAAEAEGIDLAQSVDAPEQATLAVVTLTADGRPTYDFYRSGTADWGWTAGELGNAPADTSVLHFGSLASWTPPGDEPIVAFAGRCRRAGILVSYDPNVRPALVPRQQARERVERAVAVSDVIKASREDLEWLYPQTPPDRVADRWLAIGARLIVITNGAAGADAFLFAGSVHRPGRAIRIVDTIGAGDAFAAALLDRLIAAGWASAAALAARSAADDLSDILDAAIEVAALTCRRTGADPPTLQQWQDWRSRAS